MKKITTLFFGLCSLCIFSQNIILNFDGKDKDDNNIQLNKVEIVNLNSGKTITLTNDFTINLSTVLSTGEIDFISQKQGILNVYPNPTQGSSVIELFSEGTQESKLIVYNLLGQEVTSLTKKLNYGINQFRFSPNKSGTYLLKFLDNGNTYNSKIIVSESSFNKNKLEYISSSKNKNETKLQGKNDNFFNLGDDLKYTGFFGDLKKVIYDSPKVSKTTTFKFTEKYYRFETYLVEESAPNFVDIMFSVTDSLYKGIDYLTNEDFEVFEDNAKVSATETFRYVKKLNQIPNKQKTVIMIDNSASIRRSLDQIKVAAINLVNKLVDKQEIAIYSFSDNPILLQDFTNNKTDLENAINAITLGFPSTNLYGSLVTALDSYENTYTLDLIEEGYLIALTDGDDTQGSSTLQQVISARGNKRVFMIGLGSDLTTQPLEDIGSTGGFFTINTVDDLDDIFNEIYLDVLKFSNSFYWLNYMSPKRNGQRSLTVQAKENTNIQSDKELTGTFSAEDFESVTFGVYANIAKDSLYGVDWVVFPPNKNEIDLTAYTYWADRVPEYDWNIETQDFTTLEVDPENDRKAAVKINQSNIGSSILTLRDTANEYTKDILVYQGNSFPEVVTIDAEEITNNSVKLLGEAIPANDLNPIISNKGFLVNNGWQLIDKEGPGRYNLILNDLRANTSYNYKAMIIQNPGGTRFAEEKEFTTLPGLPTLTNTSDFDFQSGKKKRTSALIMATLVNDGGENITEKGFVYSLSENPTIDNATKVINSENLNQYNQFESNLENLTPNVDYYVRGYATNSYGTSYSYDLKFRTAPERVPYFNYPNILSKTSSSANIESEILYDGGTTISQSGVVYGLAPNPTINVFDFTTDGNIDGKYTSVIKDLLPNKKYYARSYATNNSGTGYSNQREFTTEVGLAQINTLDIIFLETNLRNWASVKTGIDIKSLGGETTPIKAGVIWSTNPNPTIDLSTKQEINTDKISEFTFIFQQNQFNVGTKYYLRAYAENAAGVSYGNEIEFVAQVKPIIETLNVSDISNTSAKISGDLKDNGGFISEKGFIWGLENNLDVQNGNKIDLGIDIGIYETVLSSLDNYDVGTKFFFRAYASNDAGISYGEEKRFNTPGMKDIDGNIYETVVIGNQEWLKSNLNVSHYKNGDEIAHIQDQDEWKITRSGAWCYYENNTENGTTYGKLYNWYAVTDPRGIAPEGWKVPEIIDFYTLITQIGGADKGGVLKEEGTDTWNAPNTEATNSSGFSARGAGFRWYNDFQEEKKNARFWSQTKYVSQYNHFILLTNQSGFVEQKSNGDSIYGFSVRLLRE